MNWIDGKTNAAEIARRVCAEALSAGWWYYGEGDARPTSRSSSRCRQRTG